jgi:transaldolase
MQIFLDTANIEEVKEGVRWGIVDGVTTNPSLIAKQGGNFVEVVAEMCSLVDGPVSAEVVAPDAEGMVVEAHALREIDPRVVIKVPMCGEGLSAVQTLSSQGIPTNVTLVFSVQQAVLAAKVGATYISPFVGRIDDAGGRGMDLIAELMDVWMHYDFDSRILVASVRHPEHVLQAALLGAHCATIPPKVLRALPIHPLTDRGSERFLSDWAQVSHDGIPAQVAAWKRARSDGA